MHGSEKKIHVYCQRDPSIGRHISISHLVIWASELVEGHRTCLVNRRRIWAEFRHGRGPHFSKVAALT